jgi:hypothetical protein
MCDPQDDRCSQEKKLVCDATLYECRYVSTTTTTTMTTYASYSYQPTKSNTGSIVGGVFGGLVLVMAVAGIAWHMSSSAPPRTATLSSFTLNPQNTAHAAPAANKAEDAEGYAVAVKWNPGYDCPAAVGAGSDENNGYDFPTAAAALDESNL